MDTLEVDEKFNVECSIRIAHTEPVPTLLNGNILGGLADTQQGHNGKEIQDLHNIYQIVPVTILQETLNPFSDSSLKGIIIIMFKNIVTNTAALNKHIWFAFAKQINAKTDKTIVLSKKRNKELMQLKKQLAQKQPVKPEALYEQFHYRDVYKRINIQMESFFFERPYNLDNFNFLLNLVSEQAPANYQTVTQQILQKMELLGIKPNEKTYNYLIKVAGQAQDIELAEKYFKDACSRFLPNRYFYTSLMQNYVINNDPKMALKILDEMKEKGLEPDLPVYTTLVNCFRQGRDLEQCWKVHKKMVESGIEPDETYTGVMLKVYSATHDAQKAIKLYKDNITQKGIKPMVETTNAYFKALSSRKEYAPTVIDKFMIMAESGQLMNQQTATWALRACAVTGSVKSAGEILKIMRHKNMEIGKPALNTLLRVYSTACSTPLLEEQFREVILTDCWKLLEAIQQKGGVDTSVLNNMLTIYANSISHEQIDGLILPLYQKFGQEYNMYTYEILMEMYFKLNQFPTAIRIWNQMQHKIKENSDKMLEKYQPEVRELQLQAEPSHQAIRPTFKAMHCYLDIGIKMMDMNQVLDALNLFKKHKKMPKNATLKFLGNLEGLPEQIIVSLMDFKIQFGKAKLTKKQLPNIQDPQNV